MQRRSICLLALTPLLLAPLTCHAAVARSLNYSADYLVTSAGGATASSSNYSVVEVITTKGTATSNASSTSYSIQPVVGTENTTKASSVTDWSLY